MPRGKATGKRPDGRYMFQTTHPITKKRYTVYGITRKEALANLEALKATFKAGLPAPDEQQTVATYLDSWLRTMSNRVDDSSWIKYECDIRIHFKPAFGALRLTDLSSLMVQNFYTAKLEAGLSPATVRHLHTVLHHALDDAVRLSLVEKNVAHYARAPKLVKHKVKALTEAQTRAFLEAAADDRLYALYVIAVKMGLRVGELVALHWAEVDLKSGLLTVIYGMQRTRQGFQITEPKTEGSTRSVYMPASVRAALEAHRERQTFEKRHAGHAYRDNDMVFCNEIGERYIQQNIIYQFTSRYVQPPPRAKEKDPRGRPPLRDAKPVLPPGTTMHTLRKTARTRMAERGVDPKTAADILGHGLKVSMEVYQEVTPRMKKEAAEIMDADDFEQAN